jgi:endo-alpha-1,4-polygalactosaminidase (GH114 family)
MVLEGLFGSQESENEGTLKTQDWDVTLYGFPQDPTTREICRYHKLFVIQPVEGFVYYFDYQIKIAHQKRDHIKAFTDRTKSAWLIPTN